MFDALDVPIELVSIDPGCCEQENPSLEGCVKLKNESNAVLDVLVATLAGPGASFFIAGVFPDVVAVTKYKSDQRILWQIHQGQNDAGTYDDYWFRLQQFLAGWIRSWLLKNKDTILCFAQDLQAVLTLEGEELRQALESAWGPSKPCAQSLKKEVKEAASEVLGFGPQWRQNVTNREQR